MSVDVLATVVDLDPLMPSAVVAAVSVVPPLVVRKVESDTVTIVCVVVDADAVEI